MSMLEGLLTIGISAIATATVLGFAKDSARQVKLQLAALQLSQVREAMLDFVNAHFNETTNPQIPTVLGQSRTVTVANLRGEFLLDAWFPTVNVLGQDYRMGVRLVQAAPNDPAMLIFAGLAHDLANNDDDGDGDGAGECDEVDEREARRIAAMVGADGGWIRANSAAARKADIIDNALFSTMTIGSTDIQVGYAEGAFAGWRYSLTAPSSASFPGDFNRTINGNAGFTAAQLPQPGCVVSLMLVRKSN